MAKHYKFSQLFSFSIYFTVSLFTAFLLFNSTSHIHRLSNYNAVLTPHSPPCLPPAYSSSLLELLFFPLRKYLCYKWDQVILIILYLVNFLLHKDLQINSFFNVKEFSNVCKSNTFSLLHYSLSCWVFKLLVLKSSK